MPTETVKEGAAGTWTAGYDLFQGNKLRSAPIPRKIKAIGVTGSALANDFYVEVYFGGYYAGRFYNTTAGANKVPTSLTDLVPMGNCPSVPANTDIQILAGTVSTTNLAMVTVIIDDIIFRRSSGGATFQRR